MEAKKLFIDDGPCTFTHEGKDYTSGGAWLTDLGGRVYANWNKPEVSDWHGTVKIPAEYGRVWISNMGDKRRSVRFTYQGITFWGIWYSIDWGQCVNVRPTKK